MKNRLAELKTAIGKFISNFSVADAGGIEYIFDGDVIAVGLEISKYDEQGNVAPLTDGEYTVNDIKFKIESGKVSEILSNNTPALDPTIDPVTAPNANEPNKDSKAVPELMALIEALKAELAGLKKPLDTPVPQRTEMSSTENIPSIVEGTKYEKAFRIFSSH